MHENIRISPNDISDKHGRKPKLGCWSCLQLQLLSEQVLLPPVLKAVLSHSFQAVCAAETSALLTRARARPGGCARSLSTSRAGQRLQTSSTGQADNGKPRNTPGADGQIPFFERTSVKRVVQSLSAGLLLLRSLFHPELWAASSCKVRRDYWRETEHMEEIAQAPLHSNYKSCVTTH